VGALSRPLRVHFGRIDLAIVIFSIPALVMAVGLATAQHRPLALLVVGAIGAAVLVRREPVAAGIAIAAGATVLRLAYVGIGYSNQIDVAQAAAARAFSGQSPYGVGYAAGFPPGEPFVYGPLGVVWWLPGPGIEFVAALLVTMLLVVERSWLTLALYGGVPFAVYLTTAGVNDYSPGLLITASLLLMRERRVLGAGALAVAAALKPYAAAWFLPAIGYAGVAGTVVLIMTALILWSPLLIWGPASFIRGIEIQRGVHPGSENALDLPLMRWLAIPVALAGIVIRRWEWMVLTGAAAFIVFLFFDRWASLGYWVAVGPIAGIALERIWMARGEVRPA
jgi:hypothetical protein